MAQISEQVHIAFRLGLGPFIMLLAMAQLMPAALPPEYLHLVPDLSQMSGWKLVAYFSNHALLFVAGLWLLFGGYAFSLLVASAVLVVVYLYELGHGFSAPLSLQFAGIGIALAVFVHLFLSHSRWRAYDPY